MGITGDHPMTSTERDLPGVIAPPPLLYAAPLALALWAHHIHPLPFLPPRLAPLLGAVLVGFGFIGFAGVAAFRRVGTSPSPWRPTTALVTSGPYRMTRNPMYLGLTLMYLGVCCWINTAWPLIPLPVILLAMQLGVIKREEAYLERKFGGEFRQYCSRVRRWL